VFEGSGKFASCLVKAFEKIVFGPRTLRRTWGTRQGLSAVLFINCTGLLAVLFYQVPSFISGVRIWRGLPEPGARLGRRFLLPGSG
jgi:hypothetical protein